MSQNSITIGTLVIAFFIFITVRGELPKYLGTLGIGSAPESSPSSQTGFSVQSDYAPSSTSTALNTGVGSALGLTSGSAGGGIGVPIIGSAPGIGSL